MDLGVLGQFGPEELEAILADQQGHEQHSPHSPHSQYNQHSQHNQHSLPSHQSHQSHNVLQSAVTQTAGSFRWAQCAYHLQRRDGPGMWPMLPPEYTGLLAHHSFSVELTRNPLQSQGKQEGWIWHKNCVLSPIDVQCLSDSHTLLNAAVMLTAVTVDVMNGVLCDHGLEGDSLRPLVDGKCSFSSLSFKTTSYNLKGKPLHLLAVLLVRHESAVPPAHPAYDGVQESLLCVARMLLSPPIRVDARKRQSKSPPTGIGSGAANAQPTGESMKMPFPPDMLERRLEKVAKEAPRVAIDNSMEGLRAYLSALNIRNKSKHPLFLVLRFDACVGLLYDSSRVPNPAEDDDAFYRMMAQLSRLDHKPFMATADEALPEFAVAIKSSHDTQPCGLLDCPVPLSAQLQLPHTSSLPPAYKMLCDHQIKELRKTYCRLYCARHQPTMKLCAQQDHGHSHDHAHAHAHADADADADADAQPHAHGHGLEHHHGDHGAPVAALGHAEAHAPAPARCDTCGTQQPRESRLAFVRESLSPHEQRSAAALLANARQVACANEGEGEAAAEAQCPELEWEAVLRVLAGAIAQHCRSRSTSEILAFLHEEEASANKRHVVKRE